MKVVVDNNAAPYVHLDGCHEKGGGSEERQPRWHLKLRLLKHRPRPLHVHLQRVAGDQVGGRGNQGLHIRITLFCQLSMFLV